MNDTRLMWVTEVHNFGGFFGGDTVTLSAVPWSARDDDEVTLTIDEKALANIQGRHNITPDMLLQLDFSGERIDRTVLLGAREAAALRQACGTLPQSTALDRPHIRAYHCAKCDLWIAGGPEMVEGTATCGICRQTLA